MELFFTDDAHYPHHYTQEDIIKLNNRGIKCRLATQLEMDTQIQGDDNGFNETRSYFDDGGTLLITVDTPEDLARIQKEWDGYPLWIDFERKGIVLSGYPD